MKNWKLYVFVFALFVVAIISFYIGRSKGNTKIIDKVSVQYQELEESTDTSYYTDKDVSKLYYRPHRYENGVIPDAYTASRIAYDYVTAVWGERIAKEEQPYQVQLINNQIWKINGSFPENKAGCPFSITIERYTGKIWIIVHLK